MALPPMHSTRVHEAWMRQALEQARLALSTGDVPIGAVVLDPDGRAIGRGRNEREAHHDPTAHAEVLALRAAAAVTGDWHLEEHTLVVTETGADILTLPAPDAAIANGPLLPS